MRYQDKRLFLIVGTRASYWEGGSNQTGVPTPPKWNLQEAPETQKSSRDQHLPATGVMDQISNTHQNSSKVQPRLIPATGTSSLELCTELVTGVHHCQLSPSTSDWTGGREAGNHYSQLLTPAHTWHLGVKTKDLGLNDPRAVSEQNDKYSK